MNIYPKSKATRPGCGGRSAYMLIEVLAYIAVVGILLGIGYVAMFRCIDNSYNLRRSAEDISKALFAGERWRADVRAAKAPPRIEVSGSEQSLRLPAAGGEIDYRFAGNAVFRRMGEGPWVLVLGNIKVSAMSPDPRQKVTAWRWELELQPQAKGGVKPGRIRPLFTFFAVPETSTSL